MFSMEIYVGNTTPRPRFYMKCSLFCRRLTRKVDELVRGLCKEIGSHASACGRAISSLCTRVIQVVDGAIRALTRRIRLVSSFRFVSPICSFGWNCGFEVM